jgi:hypothetical protein
LIGRHGEILINLRGGKEQPSQSNKYIIFYAKVSSIGSLKDLG